MEKRRRTMIGTLLISVAFLLGMIFGDSEFGFDSISGFIQETRNTFERWSDGWSRPSASESTDSATIHVFDVGQGAATLFQAEDTAILIDTGRFDDSEQRIMSYLDQHVGIGNKIDLLIFTHNDADHIGNGDLVLEYYNVDEVWMNGMDHTSRTYERVLDAMLEADVEYSEPKAGEEFEVGPFWIEVLHPLPDEVMRDQNEESIVTRITVNDFSFMSSGDVSYDIEESMIEYSKDFTSEVFLVGHHGSRHSTGLNWIEALDPEAAIYQAAEENSYGHPHDEVLTRLYEANVPVFGTAEHGTITITIDDQGDYSLDTEFEGD